MTVDVMPKPKHLSSDEVIKRYRPRIEEWLESAYRNGYGNGYEKGTEEMDRLRSVCVIEAGDNDEEYANNWRDYTRFYGWCNQCHHPMSGRWAHVWEWCPWCGAKIDRKAELPYPSGITHYSEIVQEMRDMCKDVNQEEIESHDTKQSLNAWCGAWNRKMEKLIKICAEGVEE